MGIECTGREWWFGYCHHSVSHRKLHSHRRYDYYIRWIHLSYIYVKRYISDRRLGVCLTIGVEESFGLGESIEF